MPDHIKNLMAEIQDQAKELERISKMNGREYSEYLREQMSPTVRELNLSEMVGHPVKIKHV